MTQAWRSPLARGVVLDARNNCDFRQLWRMLAMPLFAGSPTPESMILKERETLTWK
jgi:hypothetical protein